MEISSSAKCNFFCISYRIIIMSIIIYSLGVFISPVLADCFPQDFEWLKVSSISGTFLSILAVIGNCCSLDGLYSSSCIIIIIITDSFESIIIIILLVNFLYHTFTAVWVTVNLLRFPRHFSGFLLISTMLEFGWPRFIIRFSTLPASFPSLRGPFHVH